MVTFVQFSYKECLTSKSLSALPKELHIKTKQTEEVLLLRLMTGTIDIKNEVTGKIYKQRINYSKFDYEVNNRVSATKVMKIFSEDKISEKKVIDYYKESFKFGNRNLFKNFLLELSNYHYQTERQAHATAFLHLYRSYELVSYCFPLFYTSKSKSYEKTFLCLKEFFTKIDGERPFFKKFVNDHLFKGDVVKLDQALKIKITAPKPDLEIQYFEALKKLCNNNNSIDVKSATPNSEIVISRRGLISLIIDIRNRYFHLLTGDFNDNFSSGDLAEIDLFFKLINDIIKNWLCIIYFEILKQTIDPRSR